MDANFHSQYVKDAVELFLGQTLISYSLTQQKTDLGTAADESCYQPFSISKHTMNVVLPMVKAFPFQTSDLVIAETVSEALRTDSPLFSHFELFYDTRQFQVELASLYLLVAILYQRQRNSFKIASQDEINQEQIERKIKAMAGELRDGAREKFVGMVNGMVKEFGSSELSCYVREMMKEAGINLTVSCSLDLTKKVPELDGPKVAEQETHPRTHKTSSKEKQFSFGQRKQESDTGKGDKAKKRSLDRKDFFFKNFIFDKKASPLIEKKLNKKIKKTAKRISLNDLPKDFMQKRNKRVIKRSFSEHYTVKRTAESNKGVVSLKRCSEEDLLAFYPKEFAIKNSESTRNSNDEAVFEEFYGYGDPGAELKFSDMYPGKEKLA